VGLRGGPATAAFTLPGVRDIRTIASDQSYGGRVLHRLRNSATELPVLPEISRRVSQVINNEKASMSDLARILREDSAIAANVLRVANSAAYGGLHTISELTAACSRLGQKTVANVVQSVASKSIFSSDDPVVGSMMEKLWRHSVAVAHFSAGVGAALSMPKTDALYLQGLFHDIGKLAILSVCRGADTKASANGHLTDELLMEVIDAYHRLAGLHMLIHWNLPAEFLLTAYYHEDPDCAPGDTHRRALHVVSLANKLAYVSGLGFGEDSSDESLMDHPSTSFLQLSDIKLASIRVDLEEKLEALMGAIA
jgi:HD-like signal output (HDOD) protein